MRVVGSIDGRKLHILIDSGSTHNLVNARFVVKLGCCKVPALGFRVNVANGEVLVCEATYPMVPMEIQGYRFEMRLYSLDLQGSDAVLSMQWLRSLGQVLHDWEKLTMEFTVANQQYLIRGDSPKGCMHGLPPMAILKLHLNLGKAMEVGPTPDPLPSGVPSTLQNCHQCERMTIASPWSLELGWFNVQPYRYPHISEDGDRACSQGDASNQNHTTKF
uniref:Uncharacterized protein n=1 Tax=Fagus sylvatica TaxID=28930 RepID=A0A2N9GUD5_FAGSY